MPRYPAFVLVHKPYDGIDKVIKSANKYGIRNILELGRCAPLEPIRRQFCDKNSGAADDRFCSEYQIRQAAGLLPDFQRGSWCLSRGAIAEQNRKQKGSATKYYAYPRYTLLGRKQ